MIQGAINEIHPAEALGQTASPSTGDPRVAAIMRQYLEALEAGRRLDREELLAQHPEIAGELVECLDALEFIREVAPQLSDAGGGEAVDKSAPINPTAALGDFRIVRQLGRGGMGVVYEAEQLSLGRRVALKVLPFAAMLDEKQIKRFQNEARAAATLDHPNIVSVYAVGSERGVHYYAMQCIEGQSMAEVIEELRQGHVEQPSGEKREVEASGQTVRQSRRQGEVPVGLLEPTIDSGTAAAEPQADEYEGVIDTVRAVQTAISTQHSAGQAEFFRSAARLGIQAAEALDHAHQHGVLHRDVKPANLMIDLRGGLWVTDFGLAQMESDAGMTMTGDVIGTLRYMSPEQALARRVVVDHRTDIYSLGVTLYELLTLQPAYDGHDRQELLKQIAFEEPKSARRINSCIPKELETIVLKAMAKNPAERYGTAQDLADDLRCYLLDKPIRAKRPSIVNLATKWSRRNRAWVVSATVFLLLAVVGLSIGMAIVSNAYWSEAQQRAAADNLRAKAESHLKLAQEAIEGSFFQVAEQWMAPEFPRPRKQSLTAALRFYEAITSKLSNDPFERARGYLRVAALQTALNRPEAAKKARLSAVTLFEDLAQKFPKVLRYRQGVAATKDFKWGSATTTQLYDDLLSEFNSESLSDSPQPFEHSHWGPLQDWFCSCPGYQEMMAAEMHVGKTDPAEVRRALVLYERASSLFEGGVDLSPLLVTLNGAAFAHRRLSYIHASAGRNEESAKEFAQADQLWSRALALRPGYATGLARITTMLIDHPHNKLRDPERALELLEKAIESAAEPSPILWYTVAMGYGRLGKVHEAKAALKMIAGRGANHNLHNSLVWVQVVSGSVTDAAWAVEMAEVVVEANPRNGSFWNTLGVGQYRAGQWQKAIESLQRSLELLDGSYYSHNKFFLAMAHWQLDGAGEARNCYDQAVVWMEQNAPGDPELLGFRAEAEELMGIDQEEP